jgi:hypothetical protein
MRPIDYLLPYILWIYLFVSVGLVAPFIFLTQGLLSYLYVTCNLAPWAAIIYFREEIGIRNAQKPMADSIGTSKWLKALDELVDMMPKHQTAEVKKAKKWGKKN